MTVRLNYAAAAPEVAAPLYAMGKALDASGLEPALLVLLQIRASQLNGCAFCLALHAREADALGERGDRISGLPAWRDAPWYSARERAALEWTEALTRLQPGQPDDATYERVLAQFGEREIAHLTLAVVAINAWNRFNLAFRTPPQAAESVFMQLHPQREEARA